MNSAHLVLNVNGGIGLLGLEYDGGVCYQWSSNVIGVRYLRTVPITLELGLNGPYNPGYARPIESIWSIDAIVGKRYLSRNVTVSFVAGIGIVGGIQRGKFIVQELGSYYAEYERLAETTYEIPLECCLSYTPWDYSSCGISYLYSINPKKAYKGIVISLSFLLPM